jgi:hypothetical protein
MAIARAVLVAVRGAMAALLLVVVLSTPALAALWMRISLDPSTPTAGKPVRVSVLTFSATQNLCWDDPRITPIPEATWYGGGDTPVSLGLQVVVTNSGRTFTVPLVQRPGDGAYWDGTMIFPSGGEWQLFARRAGAPLTPGAADRCGGSARTVEVQPVGSSARPQPRGVRGAVAPSGFPTFSILGVLLMAGAATAGLGAVLISRLRRGKAR